jgi:hypothetical protein
MPLDISARAAARLRQVGRMAFEDARGEIHSLH